MKAPIYVVAVAVAVLAVAPTSVPAASTQHVYHGEFKCVSQRGTFHLSIRRYDGRRDWAIRGETGQYAGIAGGGRVASIGVHAHRWHARLVGSVVGRGGGKQRVVFTLAGRPSGTFRVTAAQPWSRFPKQDSGMQSSDWLG